MAQVKVRAILGSSIQPSVTQPWAVTALDHLSASRRMNAVWIQGRASKRTRQCHGAIPSRARRGSAEMVANASDRRLRAAAAQILPQHPAGNPAVQER